MSFVSHSSLSLILLPVHVMSLPTSAHFRWREEWTTLHNFAALFVFVWLIGVIVHYILCQKCQWYYERVLSGGIHVSFGRLYLTTHYFDQPVQKLGSCPGMVRLWRMWFICGLLVSSLLILPSLVLLIHIFYTHLSHMFAIRYASATSSGAALPPFVHASDTPFTDRSGYKYSLMPIIPGVNLPASSVLPFFAAILISTLFHELGHGLSAASELTEIGGMGLAIIGVFPAAFVVIRNLDNQALYRQLRILCAGVWHNVVLVGLCAALLAVLPAVTQLSFRSGLGATVISVSHAANLHTNYTNAFQPGMEISSINQCNVSGSKSLERCCHGDTQKGFCLSMEDMKKARGEYMPPVQFKYGRQENRSSYDSVMECCWNSSASSSLCFHTQPTKSTHVNASSGTTECLQVEKVRSNSRSACDSSLDCGLPSEECYMPYLLANERLLVLNTSNGPVIFMGEPSILLAVLKVSNYSAQSLLPLWLPEMLQVSLQYLISVSAALALLNVVPCIGLDGQYMFTVWIELLFRHSYLPARWSPYRSSFIHLVTVFSTVILVSVVFMAFLSSLSSRFVISSSLS